MLDFLTIKTDAGLALDAAAATGATITLASMALGDGGGSAYTPTKDQTALKGERKRVPLNALAPLTQNAQQWKAEAIFPPDDGGFTANEAGLFTSDGTLYAIASLPPVYRPTSSEGAAGNLIVSLTFAVSDAETINLSVDSSVSLVTQELLAEELSRFYPLAGGALHGPLTVDAFSTDPDNRKLSQPIGAVIDQQAFFMQLTTDNAQNATIGTLVLKDHQGNVTPVLQANDQGGLYDSQGRALIAKPTADGLYLSTAGGVVHGGVEITGLIRGASPLAVSENSTLVGNTSWVHDSVALGLKLAKSFGATDGWTTLPGGLILQWGTRQASGNGWNTFTFPLSFPQQCFAVLVNEKNAQASWGGRYPTISVHGVSGMTQSYYNLASLKWSTVDPWWVGSNSTHNFLAIGR